MEKQRELNKSEIEFVRHVIDGKALVEAYRLAFPNFNANNSRSLRAVASRLRSRPHIEAEVNRLTANIRQHIANIQAESQQAAVAAETIVIRSKTQHIEILEKIVGYALDALKDKSKPGEVSVRKKNFDAGAARSAIAAMQLIGDWAGYKEEKDDGTDEANDKILSLANLIRNPQPNRDIKDYE